MASRISRGFHRVGLVLSVPVLLIAAYVSYVEITKPTGELVVDLPEGTQATAPNISSPADHRLTDLLIADQMALGIKAPPNYIVVGVPLGVSRQENVDWTRYQLRDGREIGIASTDEKAVHDIAFNFLWNEKYRGAAFTVNDQPEVNGVRVKYLNSFDDLTKVKAWPRHRERDWTFALLALAVALGIYVFFRALGWIIDGFSK